MRRRSLTGPLLLLIVGVLDGRAPGAALGHAAEAAQQSPPTEAPT